MKRRILNARTLNIFHRVELQERYMKRRLAAALLMAALGVGAWGATFVWVTSGATPSNWQASDNWDAGSGYPGDGVSGVTDTAQISGSVAVTITAYSIVTPPNVVISSSTDSLTLPAATINGLTNDGTFALTGTVTAGAITNSGTIEVAGNTLNFTSYTKSGTSDVITIDGGRGSLTSGTGGTVSTLTVGF